MKFNLNDKYLITTDNNPDLRLYTLKEWIEVFYSIYEQECESEITFKEFMIHDRAYKDMFDMWKFNNDTYTHDFINNDKKLELLDFMENEIVKECGKDYYKNELGEE